jgi:hypothetical protein
MLYSCPVTDLIRQRYSCRSYTDVPMSIEQTQALTEFIAALPAGPFAGSSRFQLAAGTQQDRSALRGLGTYGFIHGEPGFLIGATGASAMDMEDFGYRMERIVLFATGLGLGTCWLGGTFTRSGFARKISAGQGETIPAVCSIGPIAADEHVVDSLMRQNVRARERLEWNQLFFEERFGIPVSQAAAGEFAPLLEMVRLGPSASNKQPWRMICAEGRWHLYLRRTKGYKDGALQKLLGVADIQRVDMGIAMSHFALAADEAGLKGTWEKREPALGKPDPLTEYVASWSVG